MKKSLLIIAALFLVQLVHSQNHIAKPYYNNGNHGHQGHYQAHYNSNTYNGCHTSNSIACCSPSYGNHHGNHNNNYGPRIMSNQELNSVLNAIRNESFSSDKLAIARQALMFQNVKANQVVEIGNLFSFENDRLEFAKTAFRNTIDKQNYYIVNSIFHFSSSKRELDNFIYR